MIKINYIRNKGITILFFLVHSFVFAFILTISGGENKIQLGIMITMSYLAYYIFDMFSFDGIKYGSSNVIMSVIADCINIFLLVLIADRKTEILLAGILFGVFHIAAKYLCYQIFLRKKLKIAIIGEGYKNDLIRNYIEKSGVYEFAGTFTNDINAKRELKRIEISYENIKNLKREDYDIIVSTVTNYDINIIECLRELKMKGTRLYDFDSFYEILTGKVSVQFINEEWFLFGHGFNILHSGFQQRIKRLSDILFALIIFLIAFPIMMISTIIIKLESKGPVFFKQDRIGIGNEVFKIIKFRSMYLHDEDKYSKYAGKNDSRITKFGGFMRKTRIDELPQLINVLKGEMSFVGPRAEWTKLCYDYMEKIPFYNLRHSILPGLTGWAQVNFPYGASLEDTVEKLQYDLYYIKNQSFILDMVIFFKTIKTVLFGRGR